MGMTDRQFDAYNKRLLREYERIKEEEAKITGGKTSETLEQLIKDTEELLNRP